MDSRKLVRKTLSFDSPEVIPRQIWILPWAEERYPDEVQRLRSAFPDDIVKAPLVYREPLRTKGDRYALGTYVDEWGCIFTNNHSGIIGVVKEPRISTWDDLESFKPPESILSLDRDVVNAFCRESDCFVLAGTLQRPFERLQFLRTMKQAFIDLAEQLPELFELLSRIHQLYLKEIEIWVSTDIDAIFIMDDWGTQDKMMISPALWRRIFKPMYKEYVDVAHKYGKYVFMHSDGYITNIIPDLIEIGIDALNSQVFCMGVKDLGERFRGKITFWGEVDRQHLLPYGSREEIQRAVYELWRNLYADGGIIAQCEFGPGAKPENIFSVFETWQSLNENRRIPKGKT
ncbi:MAG: methyltransferase [Candidatus Aminicenantes bacterium]|nr:methyltransferase [Candidatus Aminicenantes bacterium]